MSFNKKGATSFEILSEQYITINNISTNYILWNGPKELSMPKSFRWILFVKEAEICNDFFLITYFLNSIDTIPRRSRGGIG